MQQTRFQTKALPSYHPVDYHGPLEGIMTAMNTWYSLSPEFRNMIADLFGSSESTVERDLTDIAPASEGEAVLDLEGLDMNLMRQQHPEMFNKDFSIINAPETESVDPNALDWSSLSDTMQAELLGTLADKLGKQKFSEIDPYGL